MNAPASLGSFTLELTPDILKAAIDALTVAELLEGVHSPGHEDRVGHYMYVHSGNLFFPCDPRPKEVHIEDIAAGVSRMFRFNGHTIQKMSVAEHCWHASFLVPQECALEALLHDATEGYIGDVIRPMKVLPVFGQLYLKIERGIEAAIAERFKLVYPWPLPVRVADEAMLHAEISQNVKSKADPVHVHKDVYDAETNNQRVTFHHWAPENAMKMFLDRFAALADLRGVA